MYFQHIYFSNWHQNVFRVVLSICLATAYEYIFLGKVSGKTILDVGCGPCIHTVIPAANWFDEIVLADFCPTNREMQEKWLKRSKDAHNWEPFFNYYSSLGNKMYVFERNALFAYIKKNYIDTVPIP